jgi:hypothetical protein
MADRLKALNEKLPGQNVFLRRNSGKLIVSGFRSSPLRVPEITTDAYIDLMDAVSHGVQLDRDGEALLTAMEHSKSIGIFAAAAKVRCEIYRQRSLRRGGTSLSTAFNDAAKKAGAA